MKTTIYLSFYFFQYSALCFLALIRNNQSVALAIALSGYGKRRILLQTSIAPFYYTASPSIAAAPVDAGEAIRRGSAHIPGFGSPDVYYPMAFRGSWTMHRQMLSGDKAMDLIYLVRFLPSIEEGAVVADRGFNQANLEAAMRDGDAIRSVRWTETNPNDLRMTLPDGSLKEIKVTKRATERTVATVFSSEFQRVTQEEKGIPQITARRVLTKWKVVNNDKIEGLELVYNVAGGGDPLALQLQAQEPHLLTKSRLVLERAP